MVNIGWTTEFMIHCGCRDSPFYECWGSKVKHKNFVCTKCEKAGRGHFNNSWRRQTHYIKNPKLMNVDKWIKWLKGKGKEFLLNKEGLLKLDKYGRPKVTLTTKEQAELEIKRKAKLSPIEVFTENKVKINWYGEVIRQKQILSPEEDMTLNVGTQKKNLIINKGGLKIVLGIKKGDPKEYFFKSTQDKEFNPKFWKMYYEFTICYNCGKRTICSMMNPNGSMGDKEKWEKTVCEHCFLEVENAIKSMRKKMIHE